MKEENSALTQPSPSDDGAAPAAASSPAPLRGRGGWGIAAALLAIAAAAIAGWHVVELRSNVLEIREEVAERLAANDTALAEARGLSRQQQEAIAGLQGKIGALEAHVAATEGQAAALENLYQEFSRTREDRVVAEAEQAINIAAQQLQLAGNFEAALIALQGAEARLAAHDRGQLQPLRRALARDIERLNATPQVDVPGIALRLESLLESVDALPLAFAGQLDARQPSADGNSAGAASGERAVVDYIAALARELWNEIRTLVRVERLDQSDPVLLAPAQSTYLRENLKIRLLTARLALLARDGRTYAADLAQARGWVERFFDTRDDAVQAALAELAALQTMPVKVEQPSPTESFAALRLLQARNSGVDRSGALVPTPGGRPASSAPSTGAVRGAADADASRRAEPQGRPPRGATSQDAATPEAQAQGAAAPGTARQGAAPQRGAEGTAPPESEPGDTSLQPVQPSASQPPAAAPR